MNVKSESVPWPFVGYLEVKQLLQIPKAEGSWGGSQEGGWAGDGVECPALVWILLLFSAEVGEPLEVQGKRNDKA